MLAADATDRQNPAVEGLRSRCEVVEVATVEQAIELLRRDHFSAVFTASGDFLPLERAMVSQQASLILNTIGEGVCIVDGEGRCSWMNKKMAAWPPRVHDKVRQTCREAFDLFRHQVSPQSPGDVPATLQPEQAVRADASTTSSSSWS